MYVRCVVFSKMAFTERPMGCVVFIFISFFFLPRLGQFAADLLYKPEGDLLVNTFQVFFFSLFFIPFEKLKLPRESIQLIWFDVNQVTQSADNHFLPAIHRWNYKGRKWPSHVGPACRQMDVRGPTMGYTHTGLIEWSSLRLRRRFFSIESVPRGTNTVGRPPIDPTTTAAAPLYAKKTNKLTGPL